MWLGKYFAKSFLLMSLLLIVACGTVSPSETGGASQATDTSNIIDNDAGTFVGNGKPKTLINFSTTNAEQGSPATHPAYSDALSNCFSTLREFSESSDISSDYVLRCAFTAANYHVRIVGIELINCTSTSGTATNCTQDQNDMSISEHIPIYTGSPVEMTIHDTPSQFPGDITLNSSIRATALLLHTTYVGQDFPSSQSAETAYVSESLQGKSFRFCSPISTSASPDLTNDCGNATALRGDTLFDLNSDGMFGFLFIDFDTNTLIELISRPEKYYYGQYLRSEDIDRMSSIVLPFGTSIDFDPNQNATINITLNTSNTALFNDGLPWVEMTPDGNIQATFDGIFDPMDDRTLFPSLPAAQVTVE